MGKRPVGFDTSGRRPGRTRVVGGMRANPGYPPNPIPVHRVTDIRPLPLALPTGGRETPADYLSRLSFRNGRDGLRRICRDFGIGLRPLLHGHPDTTAAVARLGSVEVANLEAHAFRRLDDRRTVYRGQTFHPLMTTYTRIRFCPACLREDIDGGSGRILSRPWRRAEWMLSDLHTCPSHSLGLVDLGPGLGPSVVDFSHMMAEHVPLLEKYELAAEKRPSTSFESYLLDRLSGIDSGAAGRNWLDDLPLYAVVRACEMTGAVNLEGIRLQSRKASATASRLFLASGFDVLADGMSAFRLFLADLLEAGQGRRSKPGPQAVFGRLYQWLAAPPHDPAYDPFRRALRDVWLDVVAVGPDDPALPFGWPVAERRLHSVRSASREFGINAGSLRKILFARGIARPEQAGSSDDRVTFDATTNLPFLRDLGGAVPLKEAARHLGIPAMSMRRLMEAGLLAPLLGGNAEESAWYLFRKADLDGFVADLLGHADPALTDDPHLVDVTTAVRSSTRSQATVLRLVLDGRLVRVGRRTDVRGLGSVLVDPSEISRQTGVAPGEGLTAIEAQATSGIQRRVLLALGREGLLRTGRGGHPRTGAAQLLFDADDLTRFRGEWVTLSEIARDRGLPYIMATVRLREAGIEPAAFSANVGAVFYGTGDVAAFDRRRLPTIP